MKNRKELKIHRLLQRQLNKHLPISLQLNSDVEKFVQSINEAYYSYEKDFQQLERILEISSTENVKELNNIRSALDLAAAVIIIDTKGIVQFVNDNFCNILKKIKTQILNKPYTDSLQFPLNWQHNSESIITKISIGEIWKGEIFIYDNEKNINCINTSIIPLLNSENIIYKYLVIAYDITQQKEIENELRKLSMVADETKNAVIITNPTGEIEWVNKAFEKITGYTYEEVKQKKPGKLLQGKDTNPEVIKYINSQLQLQIPFECEILNYTKFKKQYWIKMQIQPIFDKEKTLIQFFAIQQDITSEINAKEILKRNEEKYKGIIHNINLGLLEVDINDKLLFANKSFLQMSGYTENELLGKEARKIFMSSQYQKIVEQKSEIRKNNISDAYEIEVTNKQGEKKNWLISGAPNYNDKNEQIGSIGIHLDITHQKQTEAQLRQSLASIKSINQELNDFAYIVSHDLKAPLRAIGSLAGWLKNDYAEKLDEEGKNILNLLEQRTQRMHNLIEGVLNYSKVGQTKEAISLQNTQQIVKNIVDILSPPKNIKITVSENLPNVYFENVKFGQVFQNLMSNAIKFMNKEKGEIEVGFEENINDVVFFVKDNGPGIEEIHQQKIFQIFQTLNSRDDFESTGIGLSIVKKIVETNGGKIWLSSIVNTETIFYFSVPKINPNAV